jgi:hypothetical protein
MTPAKSVRALWGPLTRALGVLALEHPSLLALTARNTSIFLEKTGRAPELAEEIHRLALEVEAEVGSTRAACWLWEQDEKLGREPLRPK